MESLAEGDEGDEALVYFKTRAVEVLGHWGSAWGPREAVGMVWLKAWSKYFS